MSVLILLTVWFAAFGAGMFFWSIFADGSTIRRIYYGLGGSSLGASVLFLVFHLLLES